MVDLYNFIAKRTDRMKASEVREILRYAKGDVISFAGGLPDPYCLPSEDEICSAIDYISKFKEKAFQYSLTGGILELKEEIAKYCGEKLGIKASAEEILITTGSQQALDITARILIDQRDYVITELPTYIAAIQAFSLFRPNYLGIPMDDEGMKIDYLESSLRAMNEEGLKPKFLYTIPTCQNPAGLSMSMDRRRWLLELASKYDFIVVEDDPYSQIMFRDIQVKRLKSLDTEGRVVYLSTFSKIYAPGVRVGWIIADKSILNYYELAKQSIDLCTSSVNQYFVLHALQSRIIEKRLPAVINKYKIKCELMHKMLEEKMPEGSKWSNPVGGMFIFGWLDERVNTKKILMDVIQKYNVAYVPGGSFFVDGSGWNTLRLNFTFPTEQQIEVGVGRLAKAIENELKKL
ncbi:MAG: PLP-dependent aminotransferase family protein [Nitrososphaeria archaeon]